MKAIKRITAILLGALALLGAAACGETENTEKAKKLLLKGGYSRYRILLPDEANGMEKMAASELQYFMEEATGYEFDIVTEDQLADGEKYLSVGQTGKLEEAAIEADDEKLGRSGFKIVTKEDGNVYLFGADNGEGYGTVFAAYQFLQDTIGYKYYSDLTIYYEEKTEVYMPWYDMTEIPTFDERRINTRRFASDSEYATRMLTNSSLRSTVISGHSHFTVIDPDVYFADHPDWFNTKQTQLCLSNEEMTQEFIKNLIEYIKAEPDKSDFMLTLMDNYDGCNCNKCNENLKKYGTYGGINVVFMNKVAEACDKWVMENQPWRKLTYSTYAYYATEAAPVKEITNEDGSVSYEPVSDEVICNDNVRIIAAFINMNRNKPMDHEDSIYYYTTLKKWATVCKNIESYNYLSSYNVQGYMYSLNDFDTTERNVRIWKENNTTSAYYVFGYQVTNVGGLSDMKTYCTTQLLWNADLSYAELAKDFMKKSYLEAEPYMWEYYTVYRAWMTHYEETVSTDTSFGVMYGAKMLPKALMDKLYSCIDNAFAAVEIYRESDPEKYENLVAKIEREEVMPLYAYLSLHWDSFNQIQRAEMIDRLDMLTTKFDYRYYGENKTMQTQISSFRSKNQ